jgi:branched-chain amino acid transport system permease protein
MLAALVLGLVKGGIYGLLAVGLVLVYKGSRVLNFAQAEIGTMSLYVAYEVSGAHHAPYWVGALAALAFALVVGLLFERFVVRPMGDVSRLTVAVATIGLFTLLLSVEAYFFGPNPYSLPLPFAWHGVTILGAVVKPTELITLGFLPVFGIGLALFLRRTDFGLSVLAAAEDSTASRLVGVRLGRVNAFTWGLAAVLSAVGALLIEPSIGLLAPGEIGTPLFVGGLAAALLGGLTSLPGAFVGGLVVGEVEAMAIYAVPSGLLPGASAVAVFAIIVAFLLFRPQGILGRVAA